MHPLMALIRTTTCCMQADTCAIMCSPMIVNC